MTSTATRTALYRDADGHRYRHHITATLRHQPGGAHRTITHEPHPSDALELSMVGELWYPGDRREASGGGQTVGHLAANLTRVEAPPSRPDALTAPEAAAIAHLWARWHLNAMRALCAHQTPRRWTCGRTGEAIEAAEREPYDCPACGRARWDCEAPCFLSGPDAHPYQPGPLRGPLPILRREAVRAVRCADCQAFERSDIHGYRAGTAWLIEPLPVAVLEAVRELFGVTP